MHSRVYCFGRYRIDPTRHEFWYGDERINLQLKVFECLVYLLEHRDRAVCRDELISAVWGRVDVSDNVLNQTITHARHAVGDTAEDQRVIRTVRRFGYCWVQRVEEAEVDLTISAMPPCEQRSREGRVAISNELPESHAAHESRSQVERVPGHVSGFLRLVRQAREALANPYRITLVLILPILLLFPFFWPTEPAGLDKSIGKLNQAIVLPVRIVEREGLGWARLGVMELIGEQLRSAGLVVVPGTNAVALDQAFGGKETVSEADAEAIAMASMAGLVLETEARILDDHWEVSIRSVYGHTQPVLAHGRNPDLISAARIAADRMAVLLGYSPTPGADVMPGQSRLDETLHQVKAYLLADRLDKARALIDEVDPVDMRDPTLRLHQASILARSGDYQQAAEALEVLSTEIDPKERPLIYARVLNALASTYQSRADYPSSEQYRTKAIVVLERLDSFEARNTLGHALGMRGATHARMGNLEQAQSDFARARIYLEATGDQLGLARLDGNLAVLYVNLEQLTNALPPAQRAIERLRLFGEVTSELRARTVLTHLYMMMLEPDKALEQLRQLEPLLDQVSNPALIRVIDIYRIEVLLANGLIDEGTQKIVAATAEIEAAEGVNRGNWPQAIAARHAFESGDLSRAIEQASMAVHKPWDPAVAARHAQTWLTLMRAQLASGQFDEATTTSADALAWADREDGLAVGVYILLLQAEYAAGHALPERAVTLFDQALRLADRRGIPIELFHVVESYAGFLIDQGRLDEAGIIAGRVSGWADSHYGTALLQLRLYHALDNPTAWRLALARVNSLAGERRIPEELQMLSASRSRLTMTGQ